VNETTKVEVTVAYRIYGEVKVTVDVPAGVDDLDEFAKKAAAEQWEDLDRSQLIDGLGSDGDDYQLTDTLNVTPITEPAP